ncbi:unnamed protein product [Linum tenue]|uniref:Uncharacterized protein n=1 Tax=Linum tenue TaxID=586396 RepID=A0AAV0LZK3_9ROSI|nr:unnamed protein product [Linum tenue]
MAWQMTEEDEAKTLPSLKRHGTQQMFEQSVSHIFAVNAKTPANSRSRSCRFLLPRRAPSPRLRVLRSPTPAMPSFPQPGSVTICEINRQLIAAESLSDERARETYGKILGAVFSPVPFQADQLVSSPNVEQESEHQGRSNGDSVGRKILGKAFQGFVNMFQPNYVNLLPEVGLHGVSWHQHKHIIAFVSGQNQVTVCDYEDKEGKDCILISESQRDVKVLEWRPNGGKSLAIACKQVSKFPSRVESVYGLHHIQEMLQLAELALHHIWQLFLEDLGINGLWLIFFEVPMMSTLLHSLGALMEDILQSHPISF